MKKILLSTALFFLAFCSSTLYAQQNITKYIKVYFTQPIDNTYSTTGLSPVYCNNSMFDTLAAYIGKAKYTIDIAQYEYKTYSGDPIAAAINAAYSRGVKVRYIQDGKEASTNTGVSLLNSSIPVEASPTGSGYNIMHNKIVIIDEYSPDTTKTWVWTGSPDWDQDMTTGDYNNVIVFQSKVLARAFTHEFDIMWGDTTHGATYNSSAALFGYKKPNSGTHKFTIGGSEVELYFDPSDTTQNHIVDVIKSSSTDLYCGMNDFTDTTLAWDLVYQYKDHSVSTYGIIDAYTSSGQLPLTTILPDGLGSNFTPYNNPTYLYHNKYVVSNPSAACKNPMVLTGSHNWTFSAETENDENTVIVHNDTIANYYLQAFANDFKVISGSSVVKPKTPCVTGINSIDGIASEITTYPNPFNTSVTIKYNMVTDAIVTMAVYDITGQKISTLADGKMLESGQHIFNFTCNNPGVYLLKIQEGNNTYTTKLVSVN